MEKEKRLIDANALKEKILSLTLTVTGLRSGKGVLLELLNKYRNGILQLVNEQPTVDAVEVVRCKDCKYAMDMMPIENSGGCLMGECTLRKEDDIVFTAWGDEFCSYGERKDNG